MVGKLALTLIFGKPLFVYIGILALVLFLFTALIPILNKRGYRMPLYWHARLAKIALAFAIVHAIMGISLSYGF